MNILLTGSEGFIGKHLNEFLIDQYQNYNIYSPSSKELDLCNEEALDHFISKNHIHIIIHLANRGASKDTLDMKDLVEYNLRMFFNLAKYSHRVEKIITFGSGAEYGKHKDIINVKENETSYFAKDSYGFYKRIISEFAQKSENIIHLRIFGVYGCYEDYRYRFVSNTILKDLFNVPIILYQNVFFDYIYIDDLIKIIDFVIHNNMKYKIYNATSGIKIDLVSLAKLIVKDETKIQILNKGFNNEYTSNNDRIINEMGKFSLIPFKNSIKLMKDYFTLNLAKFDIKELDNQAYLNKINLMWKNK